MWQANVLETGDRLGDVANDGGEALPAPGLDDGEAQPDPACIPLRRPGPSRWLL